MELNDSNIGKLDLNNTKLHQSRSVRRRLKAAKLKVDKIRSAEIVERVATTKQDKKEKNNTNKNVKKVKTAVTERSEEKTNTIHFSVQKEEEVYTSWEALYDNWEDNSQSQNCITEIKVNRNISETSIATADVETYTNMGMQGVMCSPRCADSEPQIRIPSKDDAEYTFEMNKSQYTQACYNADKEYSKRISIINQALKSITKSYLNIWITEAENVFEDLGDCESNTASSFSVQSPETTLSHLKSILPSMEQEILQSLENSVKRLLIRVHETYTMHGSLNNAKYCIQLLDYVVNHLKNHKIRTEQIFIPNIIDKSDNEKYTVGTIGEYRQRKKSNPAEDSEERVKNCLLLRKEANLPSYGNYIYSSPEKTCPETSFYDSDEYKYVQYGNNNSNIYEQWHAICTHMNFNSIQSSVPNLTKHGFK